MNERVDMVLGCTFWCVGGVCFEEGGAENGQVGGLKSEKRSCFGRFFLKIKLAQFSLKSSRNMI